MWRKIKDWVTKTAKDTAKLINKTVKIIIGWVCENKETIGKVLIVSGRILFVAAFAITTAGFGPAGIAAGSLAASTQGNVVAGSIFAKMQSLGALGVFMDA